MIDILAAVVRIISLVLVGAIYAAVWHDFGWPKGSKYSKLRPLEKVFCWLWSGVHVIFAALVIIWAWLR